MSQNIANTSLPTPTTTQDWTTTPEEAIQSASEDDQETANVKYAKCQCHKQVKKECKAAEEVAACERVEAEHQDREECSYAVNSETKFYEALSNQQQAEEDQLMNRWSKMPVVDRPRASVLVGERPGMSVPV
ncbi:hypothetical protein EDC04DRAFT_2604528 [Pisolithus marmoratus]|nr:hypothetical protein EDC04DRAFT_2604528 [Pisolithus marmoratus]